jgi:cell wall-associated NlpC family hydrolase
MTGRRTKTTTKTLNVALMIALLCSIVGPVEPASAIGLPAMTTLVTGTIRASVDADGVQGQDEEGSPRGSNRGCVSDDGRYVVFFTGNGLVDADTNGYEYEGQDWYRKDIQTGAVSLVSVAIEGGQSNSDRPPNTGGAAISAGGRYVAFSDYSSNLVDDDTNDVTDVFYRDMETGVTTRISVGAEGEGSRGSRSPAISADGRFVSFITGNAFSEDDENGEQDAYVRDMREGTIERVSVSSSGAEGDGSCYEADISSDGRFVTFQSYSSNLVGDDTNDASDVFVHDRTTGETVRVSVTSDGSQASESSWTPKISGDGRLVVFETRSALGDGDDNEETDVYVHDTESGSTSRVSGTGADGELSWGDDPDISDNGRFVVFVGGGGQLPTELSVGALRAAPVSDNILVHDLKFGTTSVASVGVDGEVLDESSFGPGISADGKTVVYQSYASNIVVDDTNNRVDVFAATIRPLNTVPVALADSYTTPEDTLLTVNAPGVLGNDTDDEGEALTAKLETNVANGTLALAADGSFTYAPKANYHGSDSFTYSAFDGSDYSTPAVVQITVPSVTDATALTVTSGPKTLAAYGDPYAFEGRLVSDGVGLAGQQVVLQSSSSTAGFANTTLSATTAADGTFSVAVTPRSATYYRAAFAGTSDFIESTSPSVRVVPRVALSKPAAPSVMYKGVSARVSGTLMPKHQAGTKPVRIYKYRRVGGAWKSYGYVKATVSTSGGISRYVGSVSLPATGRWRLRSYCPADAEHAGTWSSGYDYVTVGTRGAQVVAIAKSLKGATFYWGATGPSKFDSSGFVRYVYARMGIKLPRTARQQYLAGPKVSTRNLKPGDLVFYKTPISHVAIYVGGGMAIDCNHWGGRVAVRRVYPNLKGATRPWGK